MLLHRLLIYVNVLDYQSSENEETTRIIIITLEDMEVGFVVDSANDVLDIPAKFY